MNSFRLQVFGVFKVTPTIQKKTQLPRFPNNKNPLESYEYGWTNFCLRPDCLLLAFCLYASCGYCLKMYPSNFVVAVYLCLFAVCQFFFRKMTSYKMLEIKHCSWFIIKIHTHEEMHTIAGTSHAHLLPLSLSLLFGWEKKLLLPFNQQYKSLHPAACTVITFE